MSYNVLSYGIIAPLAGYIGSNTDTAWQIIQDGFIEKKSTLSLNCQGSLVFSDCSKLFPTSSDDIVLFTDSVKLDFVTEVIKHNIQIKEFEMFFYSCEWYNHTGNPVMNLSIQKFEQKYNGSKGIFSETETMDRFNRNVARS